jgi:predicted ATPase/class 3 adenylate cyclase
MSRDLPSGTVTFVFTDIAGSTGLLDELGDERYAKELAEHREALRAVFVRHEGAEMGTAGDAIFVAFATASQALDAASGGIQALERSRIRVRVGVHTGTPLLTDEGYAGMDVHRASRIAGAGHGGQVLVSSTTAALVDAERFELVDLGLHRLKDLTQPERIFQLGSGVFPPIRSLSPSNLPVPTTPFLGRRSELDRVRELLSEPGIRVVTLTGPGGTGKTRLALQAASECTDAFPDGLWWVELAPLSDPGLVLSALATVTGVEERPDVALSSDLATHLATGRSLVLLDNAEHLLPSLATELAPVISGAVGATFLITSRGPLRLNAEHEFAVSAMSPEDAELFIVSKAKATGLELESSQALATLCERLDRLPLAMQLALARLKVFSVEQLAERLTHVLDLPGPRDADPRQRTLRATIEWSHSLLSPDEMTAFRRLSVFAGSATIDAIENVTRANTETLFALFDQSLIHRRDDASGPRFWMLETIREYARERLEDASEVDAVRERHARFYRALAERAAVALDGARERDWIDLLDAELENFRRTLSWFLDCADHESAQVVAGSLGRYWMERGLLSEMRSWLERSLEAARDRGAAHTLALNRLSSVLYLQGDYAQARSTALEALSYARVLSSPVAIVLAMENLASVLAEEGSLEEASALERDALDIARELWDARPRFLLMALTNLGYTNVIRSRYEEAVSYLEEAVALAQELGEPSGGAPARCNLAIALIQVGRVDEAGRVGAEATIAAIESSDRLLGTACLEVLAAVEAERGNHRFAARLLGSSAALRRSIGYELETAERALHDRSLEVVQSALTDADVAAAWADGAAMDLEDAFALIGREFLR